MPCWAADPSTQRAPSRASAIPVASSAACRGIGSDGRSPVHSPTTASRSPSTKGVTAVHAGSLALALEPIAGTLLGGLRGLPDEVLVMVDLNARPRAIADARHYRGRLCDFAAVAHIVKASTEDLEFLFPDVDPVVGAQRLLDAGTAVVLLTDGPDPLRVVTAVNIREVPVPAVQVVDTVGAGDAFGAATLTAWLESGRGRSDLTRVDADALAAMAAAARFGAQVSAVTCTRSGADPPRRAELGELTA